MRSGDTFSTGSIDSFEVMILKRYASAAGWAVGMLLLILDGKTALDGASQGVTLCIHALIPSLFPFFVLSAMLTGSLSGGGLPLAGILGGYPVGAANVARAYRDGQVSRSEAEGLVVLCDCAGPSFLFGVLGPVLGGVEKCFLLWGVYLCSIFALWLIFPKYKPIKRQAHPVTLQNAMNSALRAMAGVCGWVILFRALLAVMDRWILWLLPDWGRIAVYGIFELSNGCIALAEAEPGLRFIMAAGMVSFGGLCVWLQTASVTQGISLRLYFPGKLFQASVSMLLASFLAPFAPGFRGLLVGILTVTGWILRKSEKRCGNYSPVVV